MREAWDEVLRRVDLDRPRFTYEERRRVPDAAWTRLADLALVRAVEDAEWATCVSCGEDEDVVFAPTLPGRPRRAYAHCAENGAVRIDVAQLQRWNVDPARLADLLAAALACEGRSEELVPGRLWLLGRVAVRGGVREIFFGRALAERDGAAVLADCARFRAALAPAVLVAGSLPRADSSTVAHATFLAVSSVASLEKGSLVADRAYVVAALGGPSEEQSDMTATHAPDACVFRRQGSTWLLVFEGVARTAPNSLGMRHLAELLRTPHVEIHSVRLRDLVAGETPRVVGGAGEVLDREALRQIKVRLDANREEEDEAREFQDFARVERLQEEAESLRREVARATGLGGRRRKAADDRERARQAVAQAVRRALAAIAREHEALARHLERTVRIGATLVYEPDPTRAWDL